MPGRIDVDKKYTKAQQSEIERAFATYVAMDPTSRSLRVLSVQLGYPASTISRWSRDFQWQRRLPAADKKVNEKMLERAVRTNAERKAKNLEMVDQLADQLKALLDAGAIEIKSAQDAERIVKLVQLLTGEATEKTEVIGSIKELRVYEQGKREDPK